jgi:raffinose/stachyose/melibiose transport system substrate-binding protein
VKKVLLIILVCLVIGVPVFGAAPTKLLVWWLPETSETLKSAIKAYTDQHPGVEISYEVKSFDDLKTTLRLTLSNNEGPDITQSNQGAQDMGQLVKDGSIIPLDKYYQKYSWNKLFGNALISANRFNKDTMKQASGPIYGVSESAEFGLIYYNKDLFAKAGIKSVPKTFAEFEADLALLKNKGITPIAYGDSDQSGRSIHWFEIILGNYAPQKEFANLAFDMNNNAAYGPAELAAAAKLQEWCKKGYFTDGFLGISAPDSQKMFCAGQAAMYKDGDWATTDIVKDSKAAKIQIGVFLLPTEYAVTFGAPGTCATISKKCKNPDAAADFLNFLVTDTKYHIQNNDLPIAKGDYRNADPTFRDMCQLASHVYDKNLIGYYFDWSTPTMYNTLIAGIQRLTGQKITPQEFVKSINDDYAKAHAKSK